MGFHLYAYSESQDSAVLVPTAAIVDPSLTVSGDYVQVPSFATYLMGAIAIGASTTRARLVSPSLRRILNPEIRPINRLALPSDPPRLMFFPASPIQLDEGEQLSAESAEDAAGAAQTTILVWLSDGAIAPVSGEIFSVRVSAATTLVPFQWTNSAMLFDQTLPVGTYSIVGARFESAGLLAFRFVFQGAAMRPGGLGAQTALQQTLTEQRYGGLGDWGDFVHSTPPTVDFLATTADTSEIGVLDLVKTA